MSIGFYCFLYIFKNKKLIISIFYGFFLIVSAACTSKISQDALSRVTIFSHAKKMQKSKGWSMEVFGGSINGGDIKMLSTGFNVVDEKGFDCNSATKELVMGANEFLAEVNSDPELKPHLNHYPFSIEDVKYSLSYYKKNGLFLSYIYLREGFIVYCIHDPNVNQLIQVRKMKFSDALKEMAMRENEKDSEPEVFSEDINKGRST